MPYCTALPEASLSGRKTIVIFSSQSWPSRRNSSPSFSIVEYRMEGGNGLSYASGGNAFPASFTASSAAATPADSPSTEDPAPPVLPDSPPIFGSDGFFSPNCAYDAGTLPASNSRALATAIRRRKRFIGNFSCAMWLCCRAWLSEPFNAPLEPAATIARRRTAAQTVFFENLGVQEWEEGKKACEETGKISFPKRIASGIGHGRLGFPNCLREEGPTGRTEGNGPPHFRPRPSAGNGRGSGRGNRTRADFF